MGGILGVKKPHGTVHIIGIPWYRIIIGIPWYCAYYWYTMVQDTYWYTAELLNFGFFNDENKIETVLDNNYVHGTVINKRSM